jgi:hypothetical protein
MPSADQVPVDCAHSTVQRRKWVVLIAGSTGSRCSTPAGSRAGPRARTRSRVMSCGRCAGCSARARRHLLALSATKAASRTRKRMSTFEYWPCKKRLGEPCKRAAASRPHEDCWRSRHFAAINCVRQTMAPIEPALPTELARSTGRSADSNCGRSLGVVFPLRRAVGPSRAAG